MAWIKNWFSNMLPYEIPINDLEYRDIVYFTPEHYYQAHKFPDRERRLQIVSCNTPYAAKKLARQLKLTPEQWSDFEAKKLKIMEDAITYKFLPGSKAYDQLIATGEEEIVEWNNWGDTYWGKDINTKRGENHLGILLMKIRDKERLK